MFVMRLEETHKKKKKKFRKRTKGEDRVHCFNEYIMSIFGPQGKQVSPLA